MFFRPDIRPDVLKFSKENFSGKIVNKLQIIIICDIIHFFVMQYFSLFEGHIFWGLHFPSSTSKMIFKISTF